MQEKISMDNYSGGIYLKDEIPFNPVHWTQENCARCSERYCCFDRSNKTLRGKRICQVTKLGFCEDYDFDYNSVTMSCSQAIEYDETFDDAWDDGGFPLDE